MQYRTERAMVAAANRESVTTSGKPGHLMKDCSSGNGKKTGGKERAMKATAKARTKATRAKYVEVPRVYLGLRTLSTAENVETLFTTHEIMEAFQL